MGLGWNRRKGLRRDDAHCGSFEGSLVVKLVEVRLDDSLRFCFSADV